MLTIVFLGAFICCDTPFQYITEYMDKLGPAYFPKINREELIDVDLYKYDVEWEITPRIAHSMIFDPSWTPPKVVGLAPVRGVAPVSNGHTTVKKEIVVLDLRDEESYLSSHVPGALNLPVDFLKHENPYSHPPSMVKQFRLLDSRLGANDPEFGESLKDKEVLTLSHRGHVGRLAMSVLRERGVQARCVMQGSEGWKKTGLWGNWQAV